MKEETKPTPVREPFGWAYWIGDDNDPKRAQFSSYEPLAYQNRIKLYTAPPAGEPVGAVRYAEGWAGVEWYAKAPPAGTRLYTAPTVREPLTDELAQKFEAMHSKGYVWITTIAAAAFVRAHGITKAEPLTGLHLAVIGRKHFGNPIPQAWYAAARELEAKHGITEGEPHADR